MNKDLLFFLSFLFGPCDPVPPSGNAPPVPTSTNPPTNDGYGAFTNTTGKPLGGGASYGDWIDVAADGGVATVDDLRSALLAAQTAVQNAIAAGTAIPTTVIYIADGAAIDTGSETFTVAPGVTIASGRGRNGSQGGLITGLIDGTNSMFEVMNSEALGTSASVPPVRFTGVRLQGPDPSENAPTCASLGRFAIALREGETAPIITRAIEIDNSELFAWAIAIELSGVSSAFVHHNFIHHNRRNAETLSCAINLAFHGAGYGVDTTNGMTLVEANVFHYNRHCIASHGDATASYQAYYNVVLPDGVSHSFDMHGGADREDGTYIAGDTMVIAYNSLLDPTNAAVNVRGQPVTGAWVFRNELIGDADTVEQTKVPVSCSSSGCSFDYARMYIYDNKANTSYSDAFLSMNLGAMAASDPQ